MVFKSFVPTMLFINQNNTFYLYKLTNNIGYLNWFSYRASMVKYGLFYFHVIFLITCFNFMSLLFFIPIIIKLVFNLITSNRQSTQNYCVDI